MNLKHIGRLFGWMNQNELVWLQFLKTQQHLTTLRSRSHCRHLLLSAHEIKSMHILFNCCRRWCGCSPGYVWLENHRNLQFGSAIDDICFPEVVGNFPPSCIGKFCKLLLLLHSTHRVVESYFGDWTYLQTRCIMIIWLAALWIFIIIFLVFPILLIIRTFQTAHTVADTIHYCLKSCAVLSGCCAYMFSSHHISQVFPNLSLCLLNICSCHRGISLSIILDPFLWISIWFFLVFPHFANYRNL